MKKKLWTLVALSALAMISMILFKSKELGVRGMTLRSAEVQGSSNTRVIRSSVPGIKVEEIRQITLNGLPFVEATLRNVSNVPITYIQIAHGASFTEVSLLFAEYLGAQETIIKQFDAEPQSDIVIAAAVYADGTVEGEPLPVKQAAFYHDQFLKATDRYLAAVTAARAQHRTDTDVVGQLLEQAAQESSQKDYRTTGALAFSHFLNRTLTADDSRGQSEKLNKLVQHLQRVHSRTRSTGRDLK